MNETPLEISIREESEQAIETIRSKEAEEKSRLEEEWAVEIEEFRGASRAGTDRRIEQALSQIEHRGILDRRKLALRAIEDFIGRTVDEIMKEIREDPRYKAFLLKTIGEAAAFIPGAEIRLGPEDMALAKDIEAEIKRAGIDTDVSVQEDPQIGWGGALLKDRKTGRLLNGTVERIYFRKSTAIRRELMNIFREFGLKNL